MTELNKNNIKSRTLWIKRPKLNPILSKELIDHEILPNCFTNKINDKKNINQTINLLLDLKENIYKKTHDNSLFLPQFDTNFNNVDLINIINQKTLDTDSIFKILIKISNQNLLFDSIKDEVIKINQNVLKPLYLKINNSIENKIENKYLNKIFKIKESICNELIEILNEIRGIDEIIRECIEYKDMLDEINK